MSGPDNSWRCACGASGKSEAAAQRHVNDGCTVMGRPGTSTHPNARRAPTEPCPGCGDDRHATDHGPGYVVWTCALCGVAREEVMES